MNTKLTTLLAGFLLVFVNRPLLADWPADNARIDLSAGLIQAAVGRDIDQSQKFSDVFLGIPVTGTAYTRGKVYTVLVPDAGNGVVDVMSRGMVVSVGVGLPPDKGLIIYSTTRSSFIVRTRLYVNQAGIHSYPTQARVTSSAKLDRVTTLDGKTGTLATNIAEEAFELSRPRAEKISSDKIQKELIDQTNAQLQPQLAQGNAAFAQAFRKLTELGVPLQSYHFSSTQSLLSLGAVLASGARSQGSGVRGQESGVRGQAQSTLAPMPPLPLPMDVAVRIHQTAVNDTAQAALGGKTFDVQDLGKLPTGNATVRRIGPAGKQQQMHEQMVQDYLGGIPHHLGVKRVTITFADRDPITAQFADHCVTLTIRIKELRAGGLPLPGLTINTVYRIENSPGKVELVRQGPVHIEPLHHADSHPQAAALQAGFDEVFKQRIPVPDLTPPAQLSQIGTLVPAHGDAVQGWLLLTWIRKN